MSRSDSIRAAIAFEFAAWGDEEDEAAAQIDCDRSGGAAVRRCDLQGLWGV